MPLTRERLAEYLVETHGLGPEDLWDEAPLFSSRQLDSFAMVDLILLIEREAGVRIRPADVTLENLDSIAKILGFADRSVQSGGRRRADHAADER